MASVGLIRERTFDEIIRSKGDVIEPPYRPYTELHRDPKLMAFNFQASLDEVRELELRAQMRRRRMDDITCCRPCLGLRSTARARCSSERQ